MGKDTELKAWATVATVATMPISVPAHPHPSVGHGSMGKKSKNSAKRKARKLKKASQRRNR